MNQIFSIEQINAHAIAAAKAAQAGDNGRTKNLFEKGHDGHGIWAAAFYGYQADVAREQAVPAATA